MQKITDFALVDFFVPDSVTLPNDAERKLFELGYQYKIGVMGGKHGTMWLEIPRYLVREWLSAAQPNTGINPTAPIAADNP